MQLRSARKPVEADDFSLVKMRFNLSAPEGNSFEAGERACGQFCPWTPAIDQQNPAEIPKSINLDVLSRAHSR